MRVEMYSYIEINSHLSLAVLHFSQIHAQWPLNYTAQKKWHTKFCIPSYLRKKCYKKYRILEHKIQQLTFANCTTNWDRPVEHLEEGPWEEEDLSNQIQHPAALIETLFCSVRNQICRLLLNASEYKWCINYSQGNYPVRMTLLEQFLLSQHVLH